MSMFGVGLGGRPASTGPHIRVMQNDTYERKLSSKVCPGRESMFVMRTQKNSGFPVRQMPLLQRR